VAKSNNEGKISVATEAKAGIGMALDWDIIIMVSLTFDEDVISSVIFVLRIQRIETIGNLNDANTNS
jgi:hypothetical protein